MKQKPDNVRNSEEDIINLENVRKSVESSKPAILTISNMGQKDKNSKPSSEELSPQVANLEETENNINSSKEITETRGKDVESLNKLDKDDKKPKDIASVDDDVASLIENVKGCQLNDKDDDAEELGERLTRLDLEKGGKVEKEKTNNITMVRRQEPQEDDESESPSPCRPQREEEGDQEGDGKEIRMVKINAPTKGEEEEDASEEGKDDKLVKRSPNGIPVYHNQNQNLAYDPHRGAICPVGTPSNAWSAVPADFPDNYGCQGQQPVYQAGTKGKRGFNDMDFYEEAPKFLRPQNAPQMMMMVPLNEAMNNLDAPGQPTNNLKSINQVCRRQMSGGTVTTANKNLDLTDNGGKTLQQQQQQTGEGFDSLEFPLQDAFDLFDPNFDIEEILQETPSNSQLPPPNNPSPYQGPGYPQMHHDNTVAPFPTRMPLDRNLNQSVQNNVYSQQQQQQFIEVRNKSTHNNQQLMYSQEMCYQEKDHLSSQHSVMAPSGGKRMAAYGVVDDMGYTSDMSPCHEPQFSATPSPQSPMMDASPPPLGSSPPDHQNLSPPPSNLSILSQDSGICSPIGDEVNGSQIKSPRSVQSMSPESSSHMAVKANNVYLIDPNTSALPPQPMFMSRNNSTPTMSPPQYGNTSPSVVPPATQQRPAAYQQMAPTPVSPQHPSANSTFVGPTIVPPCSLSQAQTMLKDGTLGNDYSDPFIDQNLPALSDALEVLKNDLYEIGLQRYNIDLKGSGNKGSPLRDATPALNIPSTVPQDITSPPCLLQNANPTFFHQNQSPPTAVKPSPVVSAKKSNPPAVRKPVLKGSVSMKNNVSANVSPKATNDGTLPVINQIFLGNPVAMSPGTPTGTSVGTFVITSAPDLSNTTTTTTTPPVVKNPQGKVAIPPAATRQKPRQVPIQGSTPVLSFVTPQGGITPVFMMPQPKPRYAAIAPKDPMKSLKPPESETPVVKAIDPTGQGQNSQARLIRRGTSMNDKLNIARRSVAEMERKDLLFSDNEGDTYLHVAIVQTDENLIEALLERLVREELREVIDTRNVMGQTPLYVAVCDNKPEMVEVLVRYGADVKHFAESTLDSGERESLAAIHRASSQGEEYLKTLRALLRSPNIDFNQMDSDGHTALHCAILNHGKVSTKNRPINSIPIIEALIQTGADPNLQVQKNGKTALMFALESRNLDLIESVFRLIEPTKLPAYLKTESFDSITCHKIASSMKSSMSPANQQRLSKCLKSSSCSRADH